jgi:hypothetical protein
MNNSLTPQNLLEQILPIRRMEHGSLSVIRQGPNGPYYNPDSWEQGTNQCRYVPRDKLPEVRQAIEGYQKFQQITREYAQQVVAQTRALLGIGIRKESPLQPDQPPRVRLAQDEEIQRLMTRFLATDAGQLPGQALDCEVLLRAAVFQSTNQLMAHLFQKLADRVEAARYYFVGKVARMK